MAADTNTPATLRLQVYLSRQGVCSRRKAMELVQSGKVKLNGAVVTEPSTPVVPGRDRVELSGQRVGETRLTYVMLNKPAGYVTTKSDRFADKTVLDLLPPALRHLHPVGRLDKDTEGLLLLTNDGALTQHLTHPSRGVDKVYFVTIDQPLSAAAQRHLQKGVVIDGHTTAPAAVSLISPDAKTFHLTIHEGRKRQIRRMLSKVRLKVVYLRRQRQGALELGDLAVGRYRELTRQEVEALKDDGGQKARRQPGPRG